MGSTTMSRAAMRSAFGDGFFLDHCFPAGLLCHVLFRHGLLGHCFLGMMRRISSWRDSERKPAGDSQ